MVLGKSDRSFFQISCSHTSFSVGPADVKEWLTAHLLQVGSQPVQPLGILRHSYLVGSHVNGSSAGTSDPLPSGKVFLFLVAWLPVALLVARVGVTLSLSLFTILKSSYWLPETTSTWPNPNLELTKLKSKKWRRGGKQKTKYLQKVGAAEGHCFIASFGRLVAGPLKSVPLCQNQGLFPAGETPLMGLLCLHIPRCKTAPGRKATLWSFLGAFHSSFATDTPAGPDSHLSSIELASGQLPT